MKLKPALLLFMLFLSTACTGSPENKSVSKTGTVPDSEMSSINIPAREHGYAGLSDQNRVFDHDRFTLIKSQKELDDFLSTVEPQSAWNGNSKQVFSDALRQSGVDFSASNILIYYHTEGSGSIRVTLSSPVWKNGNAICNIERSKPMMGTADMAYYAYAYKVSKEIPEVVFVIENKHYPIKND